MSPCRPFTHHLLSDDNQRLHTMSTAAPRTHYDVLGVSPSAPLAELRAAWRRQLLLVRLFRVAFCPLFQFPPVRVPGPLTARSPSGIPIKQGPQLPMRKASISFIASLRHGSVSGTQRRARCIIGSWRGWLGEGLLLVKVCSRIPHDKSQSVI